MGSDTPDANTSSNSVSSSGLGGGAIAGIVLGAFAILAALLYGFYHWHSKRTIQPGPIGRQSLPPMLPSLPVFSPAFPFTSLPASPLATSPAFPAASLSPCPSHSPSPTALVDYLQDVTMSFTPLMTPTTRWIQGQGARDSQISQVNLDSSTLVAG